MMLEVTEQDIEKGKIMPESNQKEFEKADGSTEPNIVEAESSTKPEINGQVNAEFAEILAKMMLTGEESAKRQIEESEKRQREGKVSCCIFRIPQSLKKIHHKGYVPEIVSIGPYHHGEKHLLVFEEHKHRYLKLFLDEAKEGVDINVLGSKLLEWEASIRNSYSEKLVAKQPELLKMMLLDGCFILMLFLFIGLKVDDAIKKSPDDPILTTPWILETIRSDLLLLENQVPFSLLENLLKESRIRESRPCDLEELAFNFFKHSMVNREGSHNGEAEHLLGLIRKNFLIGSSHSPTNTSASSQNSLRLILSATRLRLQGIEFKASHDRSSSKVCYKKIIDYFFNESNVFVPRSGKEKPILEIKLSGNKLYIPPIVFDGFISTVLLNCVAFEQLSTECSNNITSYVAFMGCLMKDEADAAYLSEKGIIENYFGNGSDVSQFFKLVCKDVAFDVSKSYLKEAFEGINKYTSSRWNVECSRFKHLHFDSPWTLLSSCAVLAAILLSILQTVFGGLSYRSKAS